METAISGCQLPMGIRAEVSQNHQLTAMGDIQTANMCCLMVIFRWEGLWGRVGATFEEVGHCVWVSRCRSEESLFARELTSWPAEKVVVVNQKTSGGISTSTAKSGVVERESGKRSISFIEIGGNILMAYFVVRN
ncbi:hypothetical protein CEXT_169151 [Caerostris extrusa]|uniref:Uncharacterized protein n=1 Tax=Caerostris extrusa TaxID=172846 RepID=A0AAV4VLE9_CAEEX|nr:hypothetical protein CEXT_169151 [Caerostris extrusa]